MQKYEKLLLQSLKLVSASQNPDGSFTSLSSANPADFAGAKEYRTTFFTSLILSCLADLNLPEAQKIKEKAAGFLLAQRSPDWSFNYWAKDSSEYRRLPYPDDLDDTFCALSAIDQFDSKLISGGEMAQITKLLLAAESQPGGPYYTWLTNGKDARWRDVDLAVNSNIGYFLSLQGINLPRLQDLVTASAETKSFNSKYYPGQYPLIYFASRFYSGPSKKAITEHLFGRQNAGGGWGGLLNSALAVSALVNLGVEPASLRPVLKNILDKNFQTIGPEAFCLDPTRGGQKHYAGAASLTAAFVIEALTKAFNQPVKATEVKDRIADRVYSKVLAMAGTDFQSFPELNQGMQHAATRITQKDQGRPIVLLPYLFAKALNRGTVSQKTLTGLGLANLYGWLAYTIYDDFLDGEGKPIDLPVANCAARRMNEIFLTIIPNALEFTDIFNRKLNAMEQANMAEVAARGRVEEGRLMFETIPSLTIAGLAEKSLGHMLGPLAVSFSLGLSRADRQKCQNAFKCYLIARQLNDDMHDWEEDLARGFMTPVTARLLTKLHVTSGQNLDLLLPDLREAFWQSEIKYFCRQIKSFCRQTRKLASELELSDWFMDLLLTSLERSADMALRERETTLDFIKAFKVR